jgi:transcriptional regulator
MAAMLNAIVGLEFEVQSVQAKFKISQNRSRADQEGVISVLQTGTDASHTALMAKLIGDALR